MNDAARARAFLDELHACFDKAALKCGAIVQKWNIGDVVLELHVAGDDFARRLGLAFAHLKAADGEASQFKVRAWDSQTSGIAAPRPPWSWVDANGPRSEIEFATNSDFRFAYNVESELLQAADLHASQAYVWARSIAGLPAWETAAPMRTLLGWLAQARGAHLVHGAAIAPPTAMQEAPALLLAARGGSGKSTLAAAGLLQGWDFLGDDYVMLRRDPAGQPSVAGLYCTFKLRHAHQRIALPEADALLLNQDDPYGADGKRVFSAWPVRVAQLRRYAPLAAIVIPELADRDAGHVERMTPAAALAALAPTSLFQLPGSGGDSLHAIARLTAGVPAYRLRLGPHHAANLAALRSVLDHAQGAGARAA